MYLASASTSVKFHELSSGKIVHRYQPNSSSVDGAIRSISWSKDGVWLALVPHYGSAEILSLRDGSNLKLIYAVQDVSQPSCVAFQNQSKKYMALGTINGQVLLYDIRNRTAKKRFPRTSCRITHVAFTAKDTHCVAGCDNGEVVMYNNATNTQCCILRVPKSKSLTALRTSATKRHLLLGGSAEGVVALWDTNRSTSVFHKEAHVAPITGVAFSPVNHDLLLTAGLDRAFRFFDVNDGKCIAEVHTDNCPTAVDISADGTSFVLASQNGKVSIYDSRSIQQPIHVFEAHANAVRHIAFQKKQEGKNTSSICSLNMENEPVKVNEEESKTSTKRTSDFFGMYLQTAADCDVADTASTKTSTSVSAEAGDSFIAALGLDKNRDSFLPDSLRDEEMQRTHESHSNTTNILKVIHERLGLSDSRQTSSTPKHKPPDGISPIISSSRSSLQQMQPSIPSSLNVKEVVKEAVREELQVAVQDLKFQSMRAAQQLRRMIIDFQMSMVREFIKVENHCNSIRDEINSSWQHGSEHDLVAENESLRRRIAFLESQVSNMAINSSSNTQINASNTA